MINIGILKADSVMPDLQADHGDYSDMFEHLLTGVGEDVRVSVYDVEQGNYPNSIDDCSGYLITGSKRSVYEDEPWIVTLGQFVRTLHQRKKKLVGICFGHQLVAQELGGKTEKSARGWGVGRHDTELLIDLGTDGPAGTHFGLLSSHQDQVSKLPEGGRILAVSDFCPIAGMLVEDHILTFQGHPEFGVGYARDLLDIRRTAVGEEKFLKAVDSFSQAPDQRRVAGWIIDFIAGSAHR